MKALDKLLVAGAASVTLSVSFIAPSVAAVGVPSAEPSRWLKSSKQRFRERSGSAR